MDPDWRTPIQCSKREPTTFRFSGAAIIAGVGFLAAHGAHWEGKPKDLLARLNDFAPEGAKRERYWPRNPQNMSSRLTLAAPSLRKIGVTFDRRRSGNGRCIKIIKE